MKCCQMKLLVCLTLCGLAAREAMADPQVWTVAETRHVLREDLPESRVEVRLAAAKNEWQGFQILVRSDVPLAGRPRRAGRFGWARGAVLRAADARLYRQHQIHLTEQTVRNDQFKPGWYPDPLIPTVHPLTGKPLSGARFTAMPFDLPASETHGFWVDLYVPQDAKPGLYRGTYRVTWSEEDRKRRPATCR